MGEKLPLIGSQEDLHMDPAEAEAQLEAIRRSLEAQADRAPAGEVIEKAAREQVEKYALPTEKYDVEKERLDSDQLWLRQNESYSAYRSSLDHVQGRLTPRQRAFSRLVHNSLVETLSIGLEKTIARPSVLLGASSMTAVGGLIIYVLARHNGYAIDTYYAFYLLLISGALLGIAFDLYHWLRTRR